MLLMTLRGTPTLYYGDEIGMEQVAIAPDQVRDPFEMNVPGIGIGRDGCRTPMQWDAGEFAGFSTVTPWLPLAADFRCVNVENFRRDEGSLYWLYRRLIELRREHVALRAGTYRPFLVNGDLLVFVREARGSLLWIALNLGPGAIAVPLPDEELTGRVLISSFGDRQKQEVRRAIDLRGNEGVIVLLASGT
jgi:alpha-glucosidase